MVKSKSFALSYWLIDEETDIEKNQTYVPPETNTVTSSSRATRAPRKVNSNVFTASEYDKERTLIDSLTEDSSSSEGGLACGS